MKKLIFLFIIVSIFIFGCSETKTTDSSPTATSTIKKSLPLMSVSGTRCDSFDLSLKDISTCEKMKDDSSEKNKCYYSVALAKQDASICRKLPPGWIEWDCYECVSVIKKDLSVCDEIPVKEYPAMKGYRNRCYLTFARGMGDSSVCESFDTLNEKDECYVYVVSATGDISTCNKIQKQDGKDMCYKLVATKIKDTSVCDNIQKQDTKDDCYVYVGLESNNSEICNKINNQPAKDRCYLYVARAKQDTAICDNIENNKITTNKDNIIDLAQPYRDRCYWEISLKNKNVNCEKIQEQELRSKCYNNLQK